MSNWLKKFISNLFYEEIDDDIEEYDEKETKETPKKDETRSKERTYDIKTRKNAGRMPQKKGTGRIEEGKRKADAKVIHQYPQNGNFRFPLIPDQQQEGLKLEKEHPRRNQREDRVPGRKEQREEKKVQKATRVNKESNTSSGPVEKKKFAGENFKPSEIPSPIYGFGKRPVRQLTSDPERLQQDTVYNYTPLPESKALKKLLEEEVIPQVDDSKAEHVFDSAQEDHPVEQIATANDMLMDEEVVITPMDDVDLEEVNQSEGENELQTIVEKTDTSPDEKHELNLHTIEHQTKDTKTDTPLNIDENVTEQKVEYHEEVEETVVSEKQEPAPVSKQDENASANTEDKQGTKQKTSNVFPIGEKQKNESASKKKVEPGESSHQKQPSVPYNVMMLNSDRRKTGMVKKPGAYQLPPIHLLDVPEKEEEDDSQWLEEQKQLLELTLKNFNVQATVIGATKGPTVTRFEVQPKPGVKVNKITNLTDDIKLSLAAKDIRMEAPIPGKNAIGIEVPNKVSKSVYFREIVRSSQFQKDDSPLTVALGLDIAGEARVTDIQKMPHGLIAGATGSGKSVCINSILASILLRTNPEEVRLLLIDPKMVELAPYNGLPHLVTPVITDVKEATTALKWAVQEMEDRYEAFAAAGVRDIKRFNERAVKHGQPGKKMPYIVVVIDELADLMMVSPQDVEDAICRIAQKARACGIHLLVATQRPSVDVITGLIKANIPTRIAFSVSSQVDSRTILDSNGADKLLGKGDMLLLENGSSKPVRLQGNFVSDDEIDRVTEFVKKQRKPNYLIEREDLVKKQQYDDQEDELFEEACFYVIEQGQASSSALQRRFRIGFNRAARLVEMMEERGLISEAMGSKPRNVLLSKQEFEELFINDMHA
ncbi:DNA translocase FtsK [Pseudalkalibacillus caeni]|uniref:DNA translocase FtsK n=1 Tax=Exobacillus caeni TaxID=2574798 RepID=A0A5R9FA32_9BACL|nr:DNA translocase FtsK [Pseudalkalibacillus caeni]TLS39076.1 DNA translocase FtsK [Pseudalkalibacillus caeni]